MRCKPVIILVMLFCFFAMARSEIFAAAVDTGGNTIASQTGLQLRFDQALELAKQKNLQYCLAAQAKTAAQAAGWQAGLRLGPTANLQFGYMLENKPMVTTMDFMGSPMSFAMASNYYAGQLVVSQPIFTGGKLWSGFSVGRLQAEIAETKYVLALDQLQVDVTQAYYGLKIAEETVLVTEEYVRQIQEHLRVVKAKFREGSASNYDLLRSEVQLANLKPQLLGIRTQLVLARKKLAITLGLPAATLVQAVDEIQITPLALPALADLIEQALVQRLDLKNMKRLVDLAKIGRTLAWSSNAPMLALNGTWTYYDTLDQDYPPKASNLQHSWEIMLGLSWPIWDNGLAIPKTIEANSNVQQAELGQQSLQDGIRLEVEGLYLGLQASQESLLAQIKTVQQAETGCKIAEEQYASGLMPNLDVMDAQLALNQSKMNFLQIQLECLLGQVKLKKAVGGDIK